MKISIITVTYNCEATIRETIESVLGQSYQDVEYLIIDGKSTDTTMEIVREYGDRIHKVVSEPDAGPYDAMNKGIKLATGSVIGILHSDDRFADPDVLEQVMRALSDPAADAAYGDIAYVRRSDPTRVVRFWRAGSYNPLLLEIGWIPPHPSFFARKQLYTQWGSFRPDFRIAGDYELMLRLFKKAKINAVYIPRTMVYMRTGGLGERTLAAKARGWYEVFRAWRVNGWHVPLLMPFRSILHTTQLPSSLSRTHRI